MMKRIATLAMREDEENKEEEQKVVLEDGMKVENLDITALLQYLYGVKESIFCLTSVAAQPVTLFRDLREETDVDPTPVSQLAMPYTKLEKTDEKRKNLTFHEWKAGQTKSKVARSDSTFTSECVSSTTPIGATPSSQHSLAELVILCRQCVEKVDDTLKAIINAWDPFEEAWKQR